MLAPGKPHPSPSETQQDVLDGLAHDLKNAVSSIVMNASLVRRLIPKNNGEEKSGHQSADVLQMIDRIQAAAERIGVVTQDALDMTKCAWGSLDVNPTERNARAVVRDALAWVEQDRQAKKITITAELRPSLGSVSQGGAETPTEELLVWADCDKVPKALARLLAYAIKTSPEGSELRLYARDIGDRVEFKLNFPQGLVAPETHLKIFERDGKRANLALVHGIIDAYGGRTWVQNAPGKMGVCELGFSLKSASHSRPF